MNDEALAHALDIVRIGRPYRHWSGSGVVSTPYDNPYDPAARFVDFGLARAVTEILNACNEGRLVPASSLNAALSEGTSHE